MAFRKQPATFNGKPAKWENHKDGSKLTTKQAELLAKAIKTTDALTASPLYKAQREAIKELCQTITADAATVLPAKYEMRARFSFKKLSTCIADKVAGSTTSGQSLAEIAAQVADEYGEEESVGA